jgi:hypothetical protein
VTTASEVVTLPVAVVTVVVVTVVVVDTELESRRTTEALPGTVSALSAAPSARLPPAHADARSTRRRAQHARR